MNPQIKTILLTVLTLSCFTIALVELSGVSSTALFNKYGIGRGGNGNPPAAQAQTREREAKAAAMPKTTLVFTDTKFNFGTVTEGDVVEHAYHFKNTGTHPLLITRTDVSCGCTTPSFPKEPVPPGGEGDIVVQFNSSGKSGQQHKNVLVHSNAQEAAISIGFDADVKEK
jgi:hypothetical protein